MNFQVTDLQQFKQRALVWASSFDVCSYLDSNQFADQYSKFELLVAAGVKVDITAEAGSAFRQLATFREQNPGWICGWLTYDLKSETEDLVSDNADGLDFPGLYFFVPLHLLIVRENEAEIISDDAEKILHDIQLIKPPQSHPNNPLQLRSRFSREAYTDAVNQIKGHISRGDIYVTNFCQEFYAENAVVDPLDLFTRLNDISPNPFSALFKLRDKYILCASPERFLAKRAGKLISQPIKGTSKRYADPLLDALSKQKLKDQTKELQENVMIVDLVRNDLTRSARRGTVTTGELFGIYSFSQVHQMISTVVCEKEDGVTDVQAIKNTFPMGSMTGAPKVSAMRLMEHYERSKRGVYSGAIGYFSPDGDFDFNVVIRTLLYNGIRKYLSFQAGSAITYHADPEQEYEECLLKAQAILEVLGQTGFFPTP